jgi:hypothetical protein
VTEQPTVAALAGTIAAAVNPPATRAIADVATMALRRGIRLRLNLMG